MPLPSIKHSIPNFSDLSSGGSEPLNFTQMLLPDNPLRTRVLSIECDLVPVGCLGTGSTRVIVDSHSRWRLSCLQLEWLCPLRSFCARIAASRQSAALMGPSGSCMDGARGA